MVSKSDDWILRFLKAPFINGALGSDPIYAGACHRSLAINTY
jgi:hypothetical protein